MTDTPLTAPGAEHPLNRHLFIADNIYFLRSLDNGAVDLVVTDPPFGKGRTFTSSGLSPPITAEELAAERAQLAEWGISDRKAAREANIEWTPNGGEASYDDIWTWQDVHQEWADKLESSHPTIKALIDATRLTHSDSHAAYLSYMAVRLIEVRRILKPSGSIYLHCDQTASHYLKLMMDAIFGRRLFRNEIVWGYEKPRSAKKMWRKNHDIILFYSNSDKWTFNPQRVPTLDGKFEMRKPFKRPDGSIWKPKEPGKQASSWWYDIPSFATRMTAKERTGYPTQKPVALAERIILASSNPGDVVLDPFAGCAYVPVAAEGLGRQWIACDISVRALTIVKRQFNKFRYSVDGGPVIAQQGKKGDIAQQVLLSAADVAIRGPTQLPERTDEDPEPPVVDLVLEEPVFKGQIFTKAEMLTHLLEGSDWMAWCCGFANRYPNGSVLKRAINFHLDHVEPVSKGGSDHIYIYNRAPLCQNCNLKLKRGRSITLHQLRDEVEAEGLLVAPRDELPDLAKMKDRAVELHARRMAERGLLD